MSRLVVLTLLIGVFSLVSCHHTVATPSTAITCTTTTSTTSSFSSCTDPVTGITISIAPATKSLNVAQSWQFQKGVSGGTTGIVTWKVNDVTPGTDTTGRIDSNGNYIAPAVVPSPATVNVSAVSLEDPKLSVTSVVTILPPPVVTISPTCKATPCSLTSGTANTKTFMATVTGATTTNVDWLVNGISSGNTTFGTIDSNGVYTAPLTPPIGSTVTVTAASRDFPLSSDSATVTISGYSTSSFQGRFAFSMSGRNASGAFFRAGSFSADGLGHLTGGLEDINDSSGPTATPTFFPGTYTIASDGRGTLQFNDNHPLSGSGSTSVFHFVLVNSNHLQIIGFDANGTAAGQANLQDVSTFHTSDFFGTYVFDFTGLHGSSALSQIGEFTSDGQGHITGGSIDINDGGTSSQFQITGNTAPPGSAPSYPSTYSIDLSTGRGTLTLATSDTVFKTLTFSFYVVSRGSAKFVGTDTSQALAGVTMQQAPSATFDATSLNGNYAFLLAGSGAGGAIATAGSFSADGNSNLTAGVLDENGNGAPPSNVTFSSGGTYAVGSNGRGTATFTAGTHVYNLVFYLTTPGNAVLEETDSGRTSDGSFVQQYVLVSVAVTPANPSVAAGKTQQFTATGTFSDNSTQDLTNSVVWASGTTTVATINATGLASTLKVGSSTISATSGGVTGSTTLTVTVATGTTTVATIQQQSTAFLPASIQGSYALQTTGLSAASVQTIAGQVSANGAGAISSGTIDINTAGNSPTSEAVSGTYSSPESNGRATLTLNPSTDNRNFAVYIVNSTQVFVLGIDPASAARLASGTMYRRF